MSCLDPSPRQHRSRISFEQFSINFNYGKFSSILHLRQQAPPLPSAAGISPSQNICWTKWKGVGLKIYKSCHVEKNPKKLKSCYGPNSPSVKDRGPANHLSHGWFALKGNSIARYSNVFSASTEWYSNVLCNNTLRFCLREYSSIPSRLTTGSIVVLKDKATERILIDYLSEKPCYPHMTKSVEPHILDNRIL